MEEALESEPGWITGNKPATGLGRGQGRSWMVECGFGERSEGGGEKGDALKRRGRRYSRRWRRRRLVVVVVAKVVVAGGYCCCRW